MGLRARRVPIPVLTIAIFPAVAGAGPEPDSDQGVTSSAARIIRARCVFCHGAPTVLAFSRRMLNAEGPGALDEFLAGHHAPDPGARTAIVDLLSHLSLNTD